MKCALSIALLAAALAAAPAAAQSGGNEWRFSVIPYVWLPTVDTTLKFHTPNGNPEVNVKVNPDDYLSELEMALLLAFEARKGKWLGFTDVTYMKLSGASSSVRAIDFNLGPGPANPTSTTLDRGTQTDIEATIWTLAGGYNLVQGPAASLDLFGGAKYLKLEGTTDWQLSGTVTGPGGGAVFPAAGSVSVENDMWDFIVGVKGRVRLGEGNWFAPYYFDAGTGESKSVFTAQAGVGYAFRWGDLVFAYRYAAWEQDDSTKPVQDLKLYGFGLGGIFRF